MVELIGITQPIAEGITPEQLIADMARVSNPSNQGNHETAPRLIAYLIKHKHWSPFEMVHMTLKITTSRAIAAQIIRHRSFTFQEFSQRYAAVPSIEDIELRLQAETNRQSSSSITHDHDELIGHAVQASLDAYHHLIEAGVAKECARMILPMASTTTIYMHGSVRSWIHYIDIRTDDHTQKEHRLIAEQAKDIFAQNFPTIAQALEWTK